MEEEGTPMVKIGLLGPEKCGKTCFVHKLVYNIFNQNQQSTIGLGFVFKELVDEKVQIKFYDFSGSERAESLINSCLKQLDAIIFIYDTTEEFPKKYFLEKIKNIEESLRRKDDKKNIIYFMLGTKKAILEKREVSYFDVKKFCGENKIYYFSNLPEIDSKEIEQEVLCNYIKKVVNIIIMKKEKKKIVKPIHSFYYDSHNDDNEKYRNQKKQDCMIF